MKKIIMTFVVLLMMAGSCFAQKAMTPPHIMVVPDLIYCKSHGFTQQINNNGIMETIPDYERALSEDPTLHAVLTQIAQMITDRNGDFVIVDIIEAINNAKSDAAMATANLGDESESIDEAIIRNSEADILVKVQFELVKNGPQYCVSYVINGTDAYTNRNFAPISGMGLPSTSANPVVLLHEAAYSNMDAFLTKMLAYYQNMITKGRMVAFEIKNTSSSSVSMNTKINGHSIREWIDDFLYDNSKDGAGLERVQSGSTFLRYQGVYIPLTYTSSFGKPRRQAAKDVAQRLVEFLETKGITADYKVRGLGKVNIYIK